MGICTTDYIEMNGGHGYSESLSLEHRVSTSSVPSMVGKPCPFGSLNASMTTGTGRLRSQRMLSIMETTIASSYTGGMAVGSVSQLGQLELYRIVRQASSAHRYGLQRKNINSNIHAQHAKMSL
jgi:hypothetical protein